MSTPFSLNMAFVAQVSAAKKANVAPAHRSDVEAIVVADHPDRQGIVLAEISDRADGTTR
jgi:hypothetical protein